MNINIEDIHGFLPKVFFKSKGSKSWYYSVNILIYWFIFSFSSLTKQNKTEKALKGIIFLVEIFIR